MSAGNTEEKPLPVYLWEGKGTVDASFGGFIFHIK